MEIPEAVQAAIKKLKGSNAEKKDQTVLDAVEVRKEAKKPEPKVKEFMIPPSGPSKEKLACVKEIDKILSRYDNQEGNIPQNKQHPDYKYWNLVNKYRSL